MALAAAVFAADAVVPPGLAVWLLQIGPILLAVRTAPGGAPLPIAGLCAALTFAGAWLPKPAEPRWVDLGDRVLGIAVFFLLARELQRRISAEQSLGESEARFEAVFREAPFAAVLTNLADARIADVNAEFERLFGLARSDVVGKTSQELGLYPAEARRELMAEFRTQGAVRSKEVTLYARSGEARVALVDSRMVVAGGRTFVLTTTKDITERRRAELALRESEERLRLFVEHAEAALRALTIQLLEAADAERRRIARELHDSTAQDLVAAMMGLDAVAAAFGGRAEEAEQLDDVQSLLEKCARDIRTLSFLLYPAQLEEAGLAGAIRTHAKGFERRTGIAVAVETPHDFERPSKEVELVLFRVTQESLMNILRHSGSETAAIRLRREGASIVLEIEDAGSGSPDDPTGAGRQPVRELGVGIRSMRERLEQVGGRLDLQFTPRGTIVRAVVPMTTA